MKVTIDSMGIRGIDVTPQTARTLGTSMKIRLGLMGSKR